MSPIRLNVSAFSNLHSLFVSFFLFLVLGQNHINKIPFYALVNSRSTYYFVDLKFMYTYKLKTSSILPAKLYLFDSLSSNTISEIIVLPVVFLSGKYINLNFYVTLLNSFYSLILKYNWLIQYNLLIDLVNRLITFCPSLQNNQSLLYVIANTLLITLSTLDISLYSLNSTFSTLISETFVSTSK